MARIIGISWGRSNIETKHINSEVLNENMLTRMMKIGACEDMSIICAMHKH